MTSTEAMIYQLKNLKGKPLKVKLEHIFTYFWLPILLTVVTLFCIVSYVVHVATMKDNALTVTCINALSDPEKTDAYALELARELEVDLEDYYVRIATEVTMSDKDMLTSYESAQMLAAQVASGDVDVLASDTDTLVRYFYQEFLEDLTLLYSEEQLEAWEDRLLYMDLAFLEVVREAMEGIPAYPDPTKPERMEKPIPVALLLPEDAEFTGLCFPHRKSNVALGIVVNSKNIPNATAFVDRVVNKEG